MSDLYLEIAGAFNYLDKIEGLIRGILKGDAFGHRISLHYPTSSWWDEHPEVLFWNAGDTKRLLEEYKIYTYAYGFDSEFIWFHVLKCQARWAEKVLVEADVPFIASIVDPLNYSNAPAGIPKPWEKR